MSVTTLPTASPSFITVRKFRAAYCVDLVTPIDGMKPIRTTLAMFAREEAAIENATLVAGQMKRPLKLRGKP